MRLESSSWKRRRHSQRFDCLSRTKHPNHSNHPKKVRRAWRVLTGFIAIISLVLAIKVHAPLAQHLPFTSYSIQEGLSESVVHDIIQDREGHLWVGTGFGLNRFDGKNFRKFYQQDGLPDNRVNVILETSNGTILVGTQGGLAYLQPEDAGISSNFTGSSRLGTSSRLRISQRQTTFTSHPKFNGEIILDLTEGPDQSVWIATQNKGLWKLNWSTELETADKPAQTPSQIPQDSSQIPKDPSPETQSPTSQVSKVTRPNQDRNYTTDPFHVQYVQLPESQLPNDRITAIHQGEGGTVWAGTAGGTIFIIAGEYTSSAGDVLEYTIHPGHGTRSEVGSRVNDLLTDQNGTLWVATNRGLFGQTDMDYKSLRRLEFLRRLEGVPVERLHSLTSDLDGNIWIGSDNGALQVQPDGSVRHFTTAEGLSAPLVYSIMMDREGNVWMGTLGGGLNKFYGEIFLNYNTDLGLSNNVVTGFEESSDGRIWIATFGGGAQSFHNGEFLTYGVRDGLTDSKLYVIFEDSKKTLWIGGEKGLHLYRNRRFIKPNTATFPYTHVRSIFEDETTGMYWIGTYYDGIILYQNGIQSVYDRTNVLNNNTVMDIKQSADGTLWFATYGGAVSYDGKVWTHYTAEDGLPSNGVVQIYIDHEQRVWFSTFEGVAFLADGKIEVPSGEEQTGIITYFTIQDDMNRYWLGTNRGLYRFQPDRYREADSEVERIKAFKLYNRDQGLVANELNAGAYLMASDGSLWLGTIEGLSIFLPGELRENVYPPGIELRSVTASGAELDLIHGQNRRSFTLSNELSSMQKSIEFDYMGLSHESPGRILYRYRLDGYDEQWLTTRETSISYASLSPGTYQFSVESFNADGIASTSAVTVDFRIPAPFWMQIWFIAFILLVISGLIILYLRYVSANKQIEIERMRVQIASDLHDDVGSSLTELALQTDFLQHREQDPIIKKTLKQLGEQSRRIVSGLDDIVWSIDSRNDRAGDLTDRMQDYVSHVFKSETPVVHYRFDRLNMSEKLPVQVKENIYLVFKEAIHNIAKHSDASKVEVTFELKGRTFLLLVTDNGSDPELRAGKRKSGQGMRNMNLRAKRIGAALSVGWANGFKVEMRGKL